MDPQLTQAGLPARVDLRMPGQSGSGSSIRGVATLMQGGNSVRISAQAVVQVRGHTHTHTHTHTCIYKFKSLYIYILFIIVHGYSSYTQLC